jgi:hypothetical protein
MQIVQLVPSILEVSRELLKRTRRSSPLEQSPSLTAGLTLEERISALEENERRQAELVTTMAEQLAQLASAATALHRQARRFAIIHIVTVSIALMALVVALRS